MHENLRKGSVLVSGFSWWCKATFSINHVWKNIGFALVYFTLHQTSHKVISSFFNLYKMLWMIKTFSQEDQVKTFVENFLSLKSTEFYMRAINKLTDEWHEVIQNNGEGAIDWN